MSTPLSLCLVYNALVSSVRNTSRSVKIDVGCTCFHARVPHPFTPECCVNNPIGSPPQGDLFICARMSSLSPDPLHLSRLHMLWMILCPHVVTISAGVNHKTFSEPRTPLIWGTCQAV